MAHECCVCGQQCYCDMEDHGQDQPDNCDHLIYGCDGDGDYGYDEAEDYTPYRTGEAE